MLACGNSIYCANAVKLCAFYNYSDDMDKGTSMHKLSARAKNAIFARAVHYFLNLSE